MGRPPQGKLLRATPLKRSAAARLRSLARDTAGIKATSEATMKNTKRILANQEAMVKHLRGGEARKERRARRDKRLEEELFGAAVEQPSAKCRA